MIAVNVFGSCPDCGLPFNRFGPDRQRECPNEHVFVELLDESLKRCEYPEWTAQQIRDAEVELYRTQRIDMLPDRWSALQLLRERHDSLADLP